MKTKIFGLVLVTILAALAFSGTAFAEGEVPQPDAAEEPPTPAEQPALPEEPAPVVEAAPTEETPVETEVPVAADVPEINDEVSIPPSELVVEVPAITVEDSSIPADDSEATPPLESSPEPLAAETAAPAVEAQVLVVDASGEPLDMASQASADVIATADPYFKSGIYTYWFSESLTYCINNHAGDSHCFDGSSSPAVTEAIQDAINYISANATIPNDGKIYVEWDSSPYVQNVTIDVSQPNMVNLKGLIGEANLSGVFPTITGNVSIIGVSSGFTLSGFIINGGVSITNVTGALNLTDLDVSNPSGNGIYIANQKGNVTLTRVKSSNNNNSGAVINNTLGGNVTITNSAFDYNGTGSMVYGLYIRTKGVVTINGISASHNYNSGIDVEEFSSLTLKNAVLNGSVSERGLKAFTDKAAPVVLQNVTANNNLGTGLVITTKGSISLTAVDAVYNHHQGIYLDNMAGTGTISLISVTSSNNSDDGIMAGSKGSITLTSVKACQNGGYAGAYLDNSFGTGNVTVTSPASAGFAGANSFWGNNPGAGLWIKSKGTVTVTNVEAYSNLYDGLYIANILGTAGVTINKNLANWTNNFSDNGYYGIRINTQGIVSISSSTASSNLMVGISIIGKSAITLTDVEACNNGDVSGLRIKNTSGVTIRSSSPSVFYEFSHNVANGILIESNGAVAVSNVVAQDNVSEGILINTQGTVAINKSTASDNQQYGISITGKGAITLTDVKAFHNGLAGLYSGLIIDNTAGTSGVTIRSSSSSVFYEFSQNTSSGILITSNGTVSVSNVIAKDNGREGIKINTQGTAAFSKSTVSENQWTGIDVTGKGAITLTDVESFGNGLAAGGNEYNGLKLTNIAGTGGVTINSSVSSKYLDFSDNYNYGIAIYSNGAVSVSNVSVNDTLYKCGLFIDNRTGSTLTSPTVSISNGKFDLNNREGVYVVSDGTITLTNVSATKSKNNYSGVILDNTTGTTGGVTIKSSSSSMFYEFSKNTDCGIKILSKGAVSVSNVIANDNDSDGIYIQNNGGGDQSVSITGSTANDNTQDGIEIITRGTVTLINTGASENHNGYGAKITNWEGTALTGVTIYSTLSTKYYDFSSNALDGIYIWSDGAVSVGNVHACENKNYGLKINRNAVVTAGAISVTRGTFDQNKFGGIWIYTTPGGVTLTDVSASYNDPVIGGIEYSGVYIEDGGTVVVKSSTSTAMYAFSHNGKQGLDIRSSGSVTISNVIADGNRETNIFIQNQAASKTSPKPVSVTRSTANSSINGYGFSINTIGNVTLNTLTANGNLNGYGLFVNAGDGFVLAPASVTMTGARNEFTGNGPNGIHIETEGNISLMNTIADENNGYGIYLYSAAYTDSTGNVTINASSNFWNSSSGNDDTGLHILTRGTVNISRLLSNENGNFGIIIDNDDSGSLLKNVNLTSVDANRNRGSHGLYISSLGAVTLNSSRADSNEQRGLEIATKGAVTFNGVSASFNSTHEADILSANATIHERLTSDAEGDKWHFVGNNGLSYTITLESSDFDAYLKLFHWNTVSEEWEFVIGDENSFILGTGIDDAKLTFPSGAGGLITGDKYYILATTLDDWSTLGDYELGFNGPGTSWTYLFNGAKIDNHTGTANVTISSPSALWSSFSENNYFGLEISTSGAISLTNLDAAKNGAFGINSGVTGMKTGVTLRNTSTTRPSNISDNKSYGVFMTSIAGPVTISGRIWINDNGDDGLYLNNSAGTALMAVNLSSVTANNNDGYGIYVKSIGSVTLSSLIANGAAAGRAGVYVDNGSISGSSVTINGSNLISDNLGRGLEVHTSGIVSITGVRAENNAGEGIYVIASGAGKSVTLSNIIAQYNGKTGVDLDARGTVTLTNVRSCVNGTALLGGDGINIYTIGGYHTTINNSAAIGNAGYGIVFTTSRSLLHLLGTFYFGNDSDNFGGEADLYHAPL